MPAIFELLYVTRDQKILEETSIWDWCYLNWDGRKGQLVRAVDRLAWIIDFFSSPLLSHSFLPLHLCFLVTLPLCLSVCLCLSLPPPSNCLFLLKMTGPVSELVTQSEELNKRLGMAICEVGRVGVILIEHNCEKKQYHVFSSYSWRRNSSLSWNSLPLLVASQS